MTLRIELPWPPTELSPNARVHWRPKAEATKVTRSGACWLTKEALAEQGGVITPLPSQRVPMRWTFHPPRAGRFDRDNAIARCKALQDGIADALGIDDSHFVPTYQIGEPRKGGAVVVEVWP